MSATQYETVIGLEVHAQLNTKSKIFCGCSAHFESEENIFICPVCTGMPGSLPVLNKKAVESAVKMALATHCRVNSVSVFARKNYFYPDLPKGYQISQYDKPLAEKGFIEIDSEGVTKKIGLTRIHMEEDAGKNVHGGENSFVNLNRAGVPLIEIVSEPDIRSAGEASSYLKEIRKVLRYLQISEANMESGNLRCDVNISLRPVGQKAFGTRAEIKNMNSFRFVEKAIAYEISRQSDLLNSGQTVTQETRLWDTAQDRTYAMRSKEEAHDYRYFPEPDLLPLTVDGAWEKALMKELPELPSDRKTRMIKKYELSAYEALLLVQEKGLADYFEAVVKKCKAPKLASNWILSELLREVSMDTIETSLVSAEHLGELIALIKNKTISGKIAKTIFEKMLKGAGSPLAIVEKEGLTQVSDAQTLEPVVEDVLKNNQDAVDKYLKGNEKLLGFLVGQVMKKTQGKANPGIINQILLKNLAKKR